MDYNNNSACSASSKVNYKAMGTKRSRQWIISWTPDLYSTLPLSYNWIASSPHNPTAQVILKDAPVTHMVEEVLSCFAAKPMPIVLPLKPEGSHICCSTLLSSL